MLISHSSCCRVRAFRSSLGFICSRKLVFRWFYIFRAHHTLGDKRSTVKLQVSFLIFAVAIFCMMLYISSVPRGVCVRHLSCSVATQNYILSFSVPFMLFFSAAAPAASTKPNRVSEKQQTSLASLRAAQCVSS